VRQTILTSLDTGGLGSLFAQAYNLGTYFKEPEDWVSSPLDLQAIYENHLLPHYRQKRLQDLNMLWDEYLGYSILLERCRQDDRAYARWASVQYKDLQWKKWMDIARNGQRSVAINEISNLITANPSHPGMESWMRDLATLKDELIKPKATSITPTPATETPPEPAAPPVQ
jgi:hypothetical protein